MAKLTVIDRGLPETKDERRGQAALAILNDDPEYAAYLERVGVAKIQRAHRQQATMRHGLHAVAPTTCLGPSKCPWIYHCPIPERRDGQLVLGPDSDYPMYQACLYERMYMQGRIIEYLDYLDVDPENPIEMALVNDLAVIDLMKNRALAVLSEGDRQGQGRDLLNVDVVGFSEHGAEQTVTSLHPAADMLDRLEKRRERLISQLGESRKHRQEMTLKLGGQREDSQVLEELRAVRAALERPGTADVGEAIKLDD